MVGASNPLAYGWSLNLILFHDGRQCIITVSGYPWLAFSNMARCSFTLFSLLFLLFKFIFRERESMGGRGAREKRRESIPRRLHAISLRQGLIS